MKGRGFTLVELMIAVAILAVVAAIAIPAYEGYIRESRLGAMRMNLDTLRIAVEAYRIEEGTYVDTRTTAPATPPYDQAEIDAVYGWRPEGNSDAYTYAVLAPTASVYSLTVVGGGYWTRCDKTGTDFSCCAKAGTAAGTCP